MTEEDYKLMSSLPPEALQKMLGLGTVDDQQALLQQQMAMAEALRQPDQRNYGSVGGNIGAGIGNALGAFAGGMQQRDLMGQQRGLIDQRQGGREAYAKALADALKGRFGAQPGMARDTSWGAPDGGAQWGGMVSPQGLPPPMTEAQLKMLDAPKRPQQQASAASPYGLPPPSFFGM